MADAFGINDTSLLSGENAATARMIQDAFTRNMMATRRQQERYSLPQLSSFAEDAGLAQAQTTAGLLNQNQQLQHMIDESHHTPHGLMENLSAYAPLVGGLARLAPYLFGTDATSQLAKTGMLPTLYNKVASWFKDPNTGMTYGLDSTGSVVSMYDYNGNPMSLSQQMLEPAPSAFGTNAAGYYAPLSQQFGSADQPISGWPSPNTSVMDTWKLPTPDAWPSSFGDGVADWTSGFDLFGA